MVRYRDAGVDLEAQQRVHRAAGAVLGGRAGTYLRWLSLGGVEVGLHVDGVGTKASWLLEAGRLEVAGWDCAMVNSNDVVCDGFRTAALVDYIAVAPGLEDRAAEVLRGLARAAGRLGAAVLGGETAIMPGVVSSIDVVCAAMAVREVALPGPRPGDAVVGLESTGPHANGYSLLRRLFCLGEKICGSTAEEVLLRPVADYSPVLELMRRGLVKAAAHITGGSFTKLRRALGALGARLELGQRPCWAEEVLKRGVPPDEAYRVFNMGIGMALVTDAPDDLIREAEALGLAARRIGVVKPEGPVVVDGIAI